MERVREASPSFTEEDPPALHALPAPRQVASRLLLERMEALRGPGVTPGEVETFLEALAAPRPVEESPRLRADVMLDILDETQLCELTDGQGRRVGLVALEGLMELGYPYALEVTPEMLARARGPRRIPHHLRLGLGLAGGNFLLVLGQQLFDRLDSLESLYVSPRLMEDLLVFATLILGPPLASALGEWFELRPLKFLANGAQWLLSLLLLFAAWKATNSAYYGLDEVLLFTLTSAMMMVTAFVLRHREEPEP